MWMPRCCSSSPSRTSARREEELLGQLRAAHAPVILVINKIDTVEKENLLAVIAAYAAKFEFDAVVPVSAKFGDGILTCCGSAPATRPTARSCSRTI